MVWLCHSFKKSYSFSSVFLFLPLAAQKVFHNLKYFISRWFSLFYALFLPFLYSARPVCFSGDFGGLVLGGFGWCFWGFWIWFLVVSFSALFWLVRFPFSCL